MTTTTLRRARERRKWDQKTLALRSGVDQATVSRLENGRIRNPSVDTVRKLEKALRVRRGNLVFGAATHDVEPAEAIR